MKKSFRILLTLVLAVVMILSLTACISDCAAGMHQFVEVSAREATCTQAGNIAYKKCTACGLCVDADGKQISANKVNIPAAHTYVDHPASSASCTEDGNAQYYTCENCDAIFDADKNPIDKLPEIEAAHTFGEWIDEVPATCVATGTKGYKDCSVCNKHFDAEGNELESLEIAVNPSAHKFGELSNVIPATCTSTGTKAHKDCEYCNKHFDAEGEEITNLTIAKDPANHAETLAHHEKVDATCTNAGTKEYWSCSACEKHFDAEGNEITNLTIAALGHDYENHVAVSATCTEGGNDEYYTCKNCTVIFDANKAVIDKIPATAALGHKNLTPVSGTPATCESAGTLAHDKCACGALLVDGKVVAEADLVIAIDANAHSWNDGEITTAATCSAKGVKTYTCSHNSEHTKTQDVEIDPSAHKFGEFSNVIPATCTSTGTKAHKDCEYCNKHFDAEGNEITNLTIAKVAHTETIDQAVAATCTSTGLTEGKHCLVCETVIVAQQETPKTAHSLTKTDAKAATCTEDGNVQYWTCSVCKGTFSNEDGTTAITAESTTISKKGHQQAATLSSDASGHYYACLNGCGARLEEKDHTPETIPAKSATCTAAGSTEGSKCKDCGYIITAPTTINATGHNYGTLVTKVPATCAAAGMDAYYQCSNCNGYFTSEKIATNWTDLVLPIDPNNHTLNSTTEPDERYHYGISCSDCDYTADREEHTFGDYIHDKSETGEDYHYQQCSCRYVKNSGNCTAGTPVDENVTPATCTETGKKDVVTYCSTCKTELSRQKDVPIEKIDHTFGAWIDEVPATCVATGTKGHKDCSACEKHFDAEGNEITNLTIAKDPANHAETLVHHEKVDATCTNAGTKEYWSCSACEKNYDADDNEITELTIAALGHDYENHVAVSATCTEGGNDEYYTCKNCTVIFDANKAVIDKIPATAALGHDYGTVSYVWATDNLTCTATRTCSRDASHVETETVTASATVTQQATCTLPELTKYVATFENSAFAEQTKADVKTSDALGHQMTHHDETAATCTAEGNVEYWSCSACEKNFSDENGTTEITDLTIPVDTTNGHNPATAWSTTEDGKHYHACLNGCDARLDEAAHAYTQEVATESYLKTAATCTAKAVYYKSCVCGAKGTETFEIDGYATHTYGTWIDEVPATCVATGTKGHYTCSVCEKNYDADDNEIDDLTLAIDEDAHDCKYEDTSSTKHTVSCQREGCTYTAAVEHSYTNGVCVCEKTEPKWVKVTDASTLKAGDEIIIVGKKETKNDPDKYYALGTTQNTNNRNAVVITPNADDSFTLGDGIQVIKLQEGMATNTFAFYVKYKNSSGNEVSGYLYAASSSGNQLKTQDKKDTNASWFINISENSTTIVAQGDKKNNSLRFNSNDTLFSCYASGQQDVSIYKFTLCDHEGKETNETTIPATCTTDGKTTVTCKYCDGVISETSISALGHAYGTPTADSDGTTHTATCGNAGCTETLTNLHDYSTGAAAHTCVCGATEPTYTITVTNNALDGNSATVVVKVGDTTIDLENGVYTIYQGSEVTITVTAPGGYSISSVKKDEAEITNFVASHTFTINSNTTFEITLQKIDESHNHNYSVPVPLDATNDQYNTHHQLKCDSCTDISDTLATHNLQPEQIEGNATQHKLVCACGYEKEETHDFDPDTHECVCGASRLKTIAQALEACDELANKEYSADIWYVQGYVVGKPSFNSSYNNYTLNIAAELGGTTTLKVYGLKLNDNTTAIYENDLIVVSGYLQKFNSDLEITYQGSTDCLLETYTAGTSNISISAESSANATVTIADGKTSGTNGTSFTFTVVAASGYEVTSVKVNDSVVTADEDGKYTAKVEGATTILVATKKEGAAEPTTTTKTLSFANSTNRESLDGNSQVWAADGITFTNEKGSSTTSVADYANPVRLYKNSSIKIEAAKMTKIVFNCNSNDYATELKNSIVTGAVVSISGKVVTVEFANAVDSFGISALSAQVRLDSIDVTFSAN